MANFIRQRKVELVEQYRLFYCRIGHRGWGFTFDCDEHGLVDTRGLGPEALANLAACERGEGVGPPEIQSWTSREVTPAIVRCSCGAEHELDDCNGMGDSQCPKCHQWRNAWGQCLVDPCNWGEETGETFDDGGFFVHDRYHDYGPEGA